MTTKSRRSWLSWLSRPSRMSRQWQEKGETNDYIQDYWNVFEGDKL